MSYVLSTVLMTVGFFAGQSASKNDLDKLQGHWVAVESTRDGKKSTMERLKLERTIEGNHYTLKIQSQEGEDVFSGTIKLDATKKPKTIDAIRTEGPDKGKPMLGIYELDPDKQKVCFAPLGKERPTEFSSKAGTGHVLTIWKRADSKRPAEP